MKRSAFLLGLVGLTALTPALDFNFSYDGTIDPRALAGFQKAGEMWSQYLTDDVTINVKIGFASLGAGTLAQAGSATATYQYGNYRSALNADRTTLLDDAAVASLETSSSYKFVINGVREGNGLEIEATTDQVRLTNANAKAVGLLANTAAGIDSEISFNRDFAFDFDPLDGLDADKFDFIGIATHELGHALGFQSGVEWIDAYAYRNYRIRDFYENHFALDLFRYQEISLGGVTDFRRSYTAGNESKYFSVDGGETLGAQFSTGTYRGDGRQASHWKDNLSLGLFDPTLGFGERGMISGNDLMGIDAIGWDVQAVPEPATMAALGFGAVAVLRRRRKS